MLLGFAKDYRKVIINSTQELVLLRSASNNNVIISADATDVGVTIANVHWRMPRISVADTYRLHLYRMIEMDAIVHLPFKSWELHEYLALPENTSQSWTVKTSLQQENTLQNLSLTDRPQK